MEALRIVVIVIYSVLVAALVFLGFYAVNTPPNDETTSSSSPIIELRTEELGLTDSAVNTPPPPNDETPILELGREELGLTYEQLDQLAKYRASNPWPQNDSRRNHWKHSSSK